MYFHASNWFVDVSMHSSKDILLCERGRTDKRFRFWTEQNLVRKWCIVFVQNSAASEIRNRKALYQLVENVCW